MCVSHTDLQDWLHHATYKDACAIAYNNFRFFGQIEESAYYLHHYHHWNQHGVVRNFESHLYTNNVRSGINNLYRQLFAVLVDYTGLSTNEDGLFAIFTANHNTVYVLFF